MKGCVIVYGLLLLLCSCHQADKEKTGKLSSMDTEYKLVATGKGKPVENGNWLKIYVTQSYNDSVLHSGNDYLHFDSTSMSAESLKVFTGVREGDSLHFKVPADSAFKQSRPPFVKKPGGWLITHVQVEKILRSKEAYEQETGPVDSVGRE